MGPQLFAEAHGEPCALSRSDRAVQRVLRNVLNVDTVVKGEFSLYTLCHKVC